MIYSIESRKGTVQSKSGKVYFTESINNARKHAMKLVVDSKFSGIYKPPIYFMIMEYNPKTDMTRASGIIYFDIGNKHDKNYVGMGWVWLTLKEQYMLNPDGSIVKFFNPANVKQAKSIGQTLIRNGVENIFNWFKADE